MTATTPSQTVGPFFHDCLIREGQNVLTRDPQSRIRITGRVLDGDRAPVSDAMLEIWQPDADGRFPDPGTQVGGFPGFGRAATDGDGRYWFDTVRPGAVTDQFGRPQAPHIAVSVFARGILKRLYTRLYFADEPANEQDPVLAALSPATRDSLLAAAEPDAEVAGYRFDVILQGPGETAFFDI